MSILEKIRTKSGLLVGIIALALVIFVLESALDSGNRFFSSKKTMVGEVLGKEISIQEFEAKVEKAAENEKARSGKPTVDENMMDNIRNQVWNEVIMDRILKVQYQDLGIAVSKDELFDMVQGKNPHPSVKQAFTNPQTGVFDPNQVIQFLKNMDKDETGATKERWINFEQAVKQEKIANKFYTMIKKGIYITKAEAKRANIAQNKTFKFTYASQKYFSVPDSIFKVDESELKKYYGENKNKYNQDFDSRSIEFVSFDVNPSDEDRNAAMQDILKLGNEFALATNDSEFVNINSDAKFQEKYFSKAELSKNIDTLYSSSIGKIVGPYLEGNTYKVAKLSKIKMVPDSVKARHILVKAINGDMSKARAKADSLKKLIKAGAKFDELARVNSEDPGSGAKGGDLGFFKEGMMVKPFNDACFNGNVGDMPIVESQFGIHLIEVMAKGKESKKILVSFLDRQIDASSKTFGLIFQQASEFAGKNTTEELFNKGVEEKKLAKIPAQNFRNTDKNIGGLENSRQVVKWAFEAKRGEVSKVFELNSKYVIAVLTEEKEKGILPLEAVKKQVEFEVIKEKKAEKFINELNAKLSSSNSIQDFAAKANLTVDSAKNVTFASPYLSSGRELSLAGELFGLKKGFNKKALKGENAVYVIDIYEVQEAPELKDSKTITEQIANQIKQRVDYEVFEALKQNASIEDNRATFY